MDFDENHNICSITFEAFEKDPCLIWCIPDRLITQEMCDLAFEKDPMMMIYFPEYYKTKEMCDKAFEEYRVYPRLFYNRRNV